MNFQNNLNLNFSNLNFFQKIIGINVLMFIIYRLSSVFGFQEEIISLLSLDLNILTKPWSIISYAFIHQGLFELIFMIFLLLFTTNSISNLLGQKISINLFFTGIFFWWYYLSFFRISISSHRCIGWNFFSFNVFIIIISRFRTQGVKIYY